MNIVMWYRSYIFMNPMPVRTQRTNKSLSQYLLIFFSSAGITICLSSNCIFKQLTGLLEMIMIYYRHHITT